VPAEDRSCGTSPLAALRSGELLDLSLHPIALAVRLNRLDRVVVGRLRSEALHAHAECRLRMILVQREVASTRRPPAFTILRPSAGSSDARFPERRRPVDAPGRRVVGARSQIPALCGLSPGGRCARRDTDAGMKDFSELSEQELLALAISLEE